MSKIRKGFTRMTKNLACPFAVGGYEPSMETRNRQRLMRKETFGVGPSQPFDFYVDSSQ
jgi:hypothetical protein